MWFHRDMSKTWAEDQKKAAQGGSQGSPRGASRGASRGLPGGLPGGFQGASRGLSGGFQEARSSTQSLHPDQQLRGSSGGGLDSELDPSEDL